MRRFHARGLHARRFGTNRFFCRRFYRYRRMDGLLCLFMLRFALLVQAVLFKLPLVLGLRVAD